MKRRKFLSTVGISTLPVSGCLGLNRLGERNRDFPTVSVQGDEEQREDISMGAEIVQQFNESEPAKVRVSFKNISDSEMRFTFGASPPFSQYISQDMGHSRLVIISETNNSHIIANWSDDAGRSEDGSDQLLPETPKDGCWDFPSEISIFSSGKKKRISEDETISEEYVVLNHSKNRQCLPVSEYRFVSENYFGQDESWGFTVELEY